MWKNSSSVLRLAGEELDVVDQEHVGVAVGLLEAVERSCPERPDEVVGERLDGRVANDRAAAERRGRSCRSRGAGASCRGPGGACRNEWVVGLAGKLGDRQRRGVSEAVAVADDELVEAVARVERSPAAEVEAPRPWRSRTGAADRTP